MKRLILSFFVISSMAFVATGCGGGGGGSDFRGSGEISLEVTPRNVDPGDRIEVRAFLSSVNPAGIILKFLFTDDLSYVQGTSFFEMNNIETDINPSSLSASNSNGKTLLTYILPGDLFDEVDSGVATLQLRVNSELDQDDIAADIDVLDEDVTISTLNVEQLDEEFNASTKVSVNSPQG